jgi:hypothetical protein
MNQIKIAKLLVENMVGPKRGSPLNYRALFSMDTRYTFIEVADCFGFVQIACDVVLHKYKEKMNISQLMQNILLNFSAKNLFLF